MIHVIDKGSLRDVTKYKIYVGNITILGKLVFIQIL